MDEDSVHHLDQVVNLSVMSNENMAGTPGSAGSMVYSEPSSNSNISYGNSDTDSDQDGYQTIPGPPLRQKVVQTPSGVHVIFENKAEEIISGHTISVTINSDGSFDQGQGHACSICGDRGSGYHYSVLSCEGCKGFFKRSVQKNLFYTCKGNGAGTCVINKVTRNNCQACRFEKCLLCGMKREAVREDRSPGGKHRIKRQRMDGDNDDGVRKDSDPMSLETQQNDIINVLLGSCPDKIPQVLEKKGNEISIDELMSYGYMELKFIIEWAKKVPTHNGLAVHVTKVGAQASDVHQQSIHPSEADGWTLVTTNFHKLLSNHGEFRMFTMDDQMALLKSAFMELNVLRLSYRSIPYEDSLHFAEGLIIQKDICQTMGWGNELVHATLEFALRLRELDIDHVEFALMNAIVLTYPDAIGIVDKLQITEVQTKFLDVLRRYVSTKFPQDKGRFGKILLRLPTLRTLSAKAAERFLSLTLDGVLPLNDLVQEMMT